MLQFVVAVFLLFSLLTYTRTHSYVGACSVHDVPNPKLRLLSKDRGEDCTVFISGVSTKHHEKTVYVSLCTAAISAIIIISLYSSPC